MRPDHRSPGVHNGLYNNNVNAKPVSSVNATQGLQRSLPTRGGTENNHYIIDMTTGTTYLKGKLLGKVNDPPQFSLLHLLLF
jgi:hypothetical protein